MRVSKDEANEMPQSRLLSLVNTTAACYQSLHVRAEPALLVHFFATLTRTLHCYIHF